MSYYSYPQYGGQFSNGEENPEDAATPQRTYFYPAAYGAGGAYGHYYYQNCMTPTTAQYPMPYNVAAPHPVPTQGGHLGPKPGDNEGQRTPSTPVTSTRPVETEAAQYQRSVSYPGVYYPGGPYMYPYGYSPQAQGFANQTRPMWFPYGYPNPASYQTPQKTPGLSNSNEPSPGTTSGPRTPGDVDDSEEETPTKKPSFRARLQEKKKHNVPAFPIKRAGRSPYRPASPPPQTRSAFQAKLAAAVRAVPGTHSRLRRLRSDDDLISLTELSLDDDDDEGAEDDVEHCEIDVYDAPDVPN